MRYWSTIQILLFLSSLMLSCASLSMDKKHHYSFLNETYKPFCVEDALDENEMKAENALREVRRLELNSWIPIVGEHLVGAIVLLCNNKPAQMLNYINNIVNYSISYASPFLMCFAVLVLLCGLWFYSIFWKSETKSLNKVVGLELNNKTQIFISIFVITLLMAISVSLYGISISSRTDRTLNKFWCTLVDQDNGYIRDRNETRGGPLDFAVEINKFTSFLDKRYITIKSEVAKLQKNNTINNNYALSDELSSDLAIIGSQYKELSEIAHHPTVISELLLRTIANESSSLIYFNDTLEYERQVMIGFTYIKANLDKYGQKFLGIPTTVFSNLIQFILAITVIASFLSLFGIGYIIGREKFHQIYIKYIVQYILGVVCAICLIIAIVNSFLGITVHIAYETATYLKIGDHPRVEFLTAGSLNDPLVEIMGSFWPQSSGNMSHYGNSSLITHLQLLEQEISQFNQISFQKLQNSNTVLANATEVDFQTLINYQQSLIAINNEVKAIRTEMISPDGLDRLDPRAFGRNVYDYLLLVDIFFNRCFENRLVFGFLSLFLFIAILSTIFIGFSYKSYIKTNQTDTESQFQELSIPVKQEAVEMINYN